MKFNEIYERIKDSKEHKDFIKENKEAYFCSAFFSLDNDMKFEKIGLDFFIPSSKKIFSFDLSNEKIQVNPIENYSEIIPEKIPMSFNFDFEEINEIILEKMKKESLNSAIKKYLFSFQSLKKVPYLIGTLFLQNMGLLKVEIDLKTKEIKAFDRKSFFDVLKVIKKK